MDISYTIANTTLHFNDGKELFLQYARSLSIDLSFQNFTEELNTINTQYNKPKGALILAYNEKTAVGCCGIREMDIETAELKRMYIQQGYRGHKIGSKLLELSIAIARELSYQKLRLDTLPDMTQAQQLYRAYGFYEIPFYRFNPVNGTVYMEKELD